MYGGIKWAQLCCKCKDCGEMWVGGQVQSDGRINQSLHVSYYSKDRK